MLHKCCLLQVPCLRFRNLISMAQVHHLGEAGRFRWNLVRKQVIFQNLVQHRRTNSWITNICKLHNHKYFKALRNKELNHNYAAFFSRYPGCACDIPSHLYSFSFFQVMLCIFLFVSKIANYLVKRMSPRPIQPTGPSI